MTPHTMEFVFRAVTQNILTVALDRFGCCVVQDCLDSPDLQLCREVTMAVVENVLAIAVNKFGNYVVQHVIEQRDPEVCDLLFQQMRGNILQFGCDKFASCVLEVCACSCACLCVCVCCIGDAQVRWVMFVWQRVFDDDPSLAGARHLVLSELAESDKASLEQLVGSPYGNYVVQKALSVSDHDAVPALRVMVRPMVETMGGGKAWKHKLRKMLTVHTRGEHSPAAEPSHVESLAEALARIDLTIGTAAISDHGSRLLVKVLAHRHSSYQLM